MVKLGLYPELAILFATIHPKLPVEVLVFVMPPQSPATANVNLFRFVAPPLRSQDGESLGISTEE